MSGGRAVACSLRSFGLVHTEKVRLSYYDQITMVVEGKTFRLKAVVGCYGHAQNFMPVPHSENTGRCLTQNPQIAVWPDTQSCNINNPHVYGFRLGRTNLAVWVKGDPQQDEGRFFPHCQQCLRGAVKTKTFKAFVVGMSGAKVNAYA